MERPTPSYSRRLSMESTTTSEFEVISRHGSSRGNTVRGSDSDDDSTQNQRQSPSDSLSMPPPYSECLRDDQELPLLKMPEGDDDEGMKVQQLLERNRMLENFLISSKSRENQQAREIEQLRQQNLELSEQLKKHQEEHRPSTILKGISANDSSTSFYLRLVVVASIVAVLALYLICYAQLLNERRNSESLKEILERMGDIVEKLEVKHKAEYEQLLEETTRQITDNMNANISLAHRERELEHERLIEAYREKMILYNDLDELRKKKSHKRRSSFEF
uniref:Uncharacterized protein n=1 Tax=Angiostrongylus cantonensis TaxID=6313 RepID=A0A158PB87_ANGCA